jgi:hypothetical protein
MSISYRVITINLLVAINCTSGLIKKLISMMGKYLLKTQAMDLFDFWKVFG